MGWKIMLYKVIQKNKPVLLEDHSKISVIFLP